MRGFYRLVVFKVPVVGEHVSLQSVLGGSFHS